MLLRGMGRNAVALLIPFLFLVFVNCGETKEKVYPGNNSVSIRTSPLRFQAAYKWKVQYDTMQTVFARIDPPSGFVLVTDTTDAYACWLQHLPLKKTGAPVLLYNGKQKNRQDVHAAVIDIDPGTKDLQQCADAVMRLRAEYLFGDGRKNEISFNYTSGDKIPFKKWSEGNRPVVKGNHVNWVRNAQASSDYSSFKNYLWNVFNYAGSKSLSSEMRTVSDFKSIKAGDVLIIGGFPGHAMTVIETAVNSATGKKVFLLAQSYMPAQEIHIVKNFENEGLSPWFEIPDGDAIETPEWTFTKSDLKRWP